MSVKTIPNESTHCESTIDTDSIGYCRNWGTNMQARQITLYGERIESTLCASLLALQYNKAHCTVHFMKN